MNARQLARKIQTLSDRVDSLPEPIPIRPGPLADLLRDAKEAIARFDAERQLAGLPPIEPGPPRPIAEVIAYATEMLRRHDPEHPLVQSFDAERQREQEATKL
jgi:hypothetical protein